jgi:hypothetical protein
MLLVKIHNAYREVIAVCDSELVGKHFEEGKMQIDITEAFYKGTEMDEKKADEFIKRKLADDACFNFVGERAINAALKAGAINKKGIIRIQGIPHALGLL